MARILFVVPYPVSRIRIRSYGFITQLSKVHNVTVIALCTNERDIADTYNLQKQGISFILVSEKRLYQYFRGLKALSSGLPFQVEFGAVPKLRAAISKQLTSGHFDLLHVEFIRAIGALPASISIPVVWDAVDCISQLYEQGARFGATRMLRIIGQREAGRVRDYELKQLQHFRHVLVTSERDRQALLALSDDHFAVTARKAIAEITVLPHGVDQSYFQRYTGTRRPETLIFSGKMSFHANVAGALHMVEHILPHIWKRRPDVRLIIAGSDPPATIRRLGNDPRIETTHYVPDLRPYIAQAQVAVCPLPYAVGIQNKVLEAMALGTPVVASSSASAGLQAIAGRDLLVADDPETFADAVLRLLDNHTLWNKLAEGGLAYIATHHNWELILRQLNAVYAQAVGTANTGETLAI
jgi:glycosyltransferase involved in cell wall biosynthesis